MRRTALGLVLGLIGTLGTVLACSGDRGTATDPPAATSPDPTDDASYPDAQGDVLGSLPNGPVSPAALCTSTYGTLYDSYDACCTAMDRTSLRYQLVFGQLGVIKESCTPQLEALTCVGFAGQSEGRCTRPPAIGEACGGGKTDAGGGDAVIAFAFGVHPKCETDATCNRSTGRCVASLGANEACSDTEQCKAGLTCLLGKCSAAAPSAAGGPCRSNKDCAGIALFCEAGAAGAAGKCTAKKPAGAPCAAAGQCVAPDGGTAGQCVSFCGSG